MASSCALHIKRQDLAAAASIVLVFLCVTDFAFSFNRDFPLVCNIHGAEAVMKMRAMNDAGKVV
jgi:hypothetical protein